MVCCLQPQGLMHTAVTWSKFCPSQALLSKSNPPLPPKNLEFLVGMADLRSGIPLIWTSATWARGKTTLIISTHLVPRDHDSAELFEVQLWMGKLRQKSSIGKPNRLGAAQTSASDSRSNVLSSSLLCLQPKKVYIELDNLDLNHHSNSSPLCGLRAVAYLL